MEAGLLAGQGCCRGCHSHTSVFMGAGHRASHALADSAQGELGVGGVFETPSSQQERTRLPPAVSDTGQEPGALYTLACSSGPTRARVFFLGPRSPWLPISRALGTRFGLRAKGTEPQRGAASPQPPTEPGDQQAQGRGVEMGARGGESVWND